MKHHDCEICRETMRTVNRTARFWEFINGTWVKLSLKVGQSVKHVHHSRDEEGYSLEVNRWTHAENGFVFNAFFMEGTDCDGRVTRGGELRCHVEKLKARERVWHDPDPDAPKLIPKWEKVEAFNRDYSAEAAGY